MGLPLKMVPKPLLVQIAAAQTGASYREHKPSYSNLTGYGSVSKLNSKGWL